MTQAGGGILERFRVQYAAQRAAEGRHYTEAELFSLPYLASGPLARQWSVRARTFDAFMRCILLPLARQASRPLRVLDLGAGNGWLSYRAALAGCSATAVDLRDDTVDGLGAAAGYLRAGGVGFHRVVASFDALPLAALSMDVVVFSAALHYAVDLDSVLREAHRVARPGGRLVILDSPFYRRASDGDAMVAEKRRDAPRRFGARAEALLALPVIEYLTRDRLDASCARLGLRWRRHRVTYPLWYEARALSARLRGRRPPSRFDLWESVVR
jgi:SAM-dependent methyltransferase